MSLSDQSGGLEFRVRLLERSVADAVARLGELARSIAAIKGDSSSSAPEQTIIIDADAIAPFASGFHAREMDASGRPFRWTGGDDFFEMRCFANRNIPWTFELSIMSNPHVEIRQLRAFVDYVEVSVEIDAAGERVTGCLPVKPLSTLTTITFYLPAYFVPSHLDPASVDNRTLGVVFYGLRLDPVRPVQQS